MMQIDASKMNYTFLLGPAIICLFFCLQTVSFREGTLILSYPIHPYVGRNKLIFGKRTYMQVFPDINFAQKQLNGFKEAKQRMSQHCP